MTRSDAEDSGRADDPCSSEDSVCVPSLAENPVSSLLLLEKNHGVSPTGPHTPTPISSSASTSSPPPAHTPDPLASLSNMTVPGSQLDGQGKGQGVLIEEEGSTVSSAGNISASPVPPKRAESGGKSSPRMTSIVLPVPSLSQAMFVSQEKESLKRAASVPKNHGRDSAAQSISIYERMAAQALAAARLSSVVTTEGADDEPLDLSRKSSRGRSVSDPDRATSSSKEGGSQQGGVRKNLSNGVSSLESLQKRFGGDFLLRSPRQAGSSSSIPLQSTILPTTPILRPPSLSGNGLAHLNISVAAAAAAAAAATSASYHHHHHHRHHHQPHHRHNHHQHQHQHATPAKSKSSWDGKGEHVGKLSPPSATTTTTSSALDATTTSKKHDKPQESAEPPPAKTEGKKPGAGGSLPESAASQPAGDGESKYTTHRCSCQKTFGTLYALSAHLQETGHTPGSSRHASLMDYPKLVRGQDMWLNQESEQTRRILRCMQCGESFKSLPMLTVHMMQTQHYSKIVSAEHGRRSHKCSAYCDREMDRECIFKCKVCQETYTDMEGLANHMIMSGHHKKQAGRSKHCTQLALPHSQHRKHYLATATAAADPSEAAWASLLEYKRKCLGRDEESFKGDHVRDAMMLSGEGTIACDCCGKRVERRAFLDHVQSCLPQKNVLDALKVKLSGEEDSLAKPAESTASSDSQRESPGALEQPLPSTQGSSFFRRLNSLSSASPGRDSDSGDSGDKHSENVEDKPECDISAEKNETQTDDKLDDKESDEPCPESNCVHDNPSGSPEAQSSSCSKNSPSPDGNAESNGVEQECDREKLVVQTPPSEEEEEITDSLSPKMDTTETEETETNRNSSSRVENTPSPVNEACHSPHLSPPSQSELGHSAGSRPPSSSPSPSPSPPAHQTASPGSTSPKHSLKRRQKPAEDDDETSQPDHKKMKLEEPPEDEQGHTNVVKKIKEEPGDDDGFKRSPRPKCELAPSEDRMEIGQKPQSSRQDPQLDIIDPNGQAAAEEGGNSALRAMESFIQRSFSSKFDSRRNSADFGAFGASAHRGLPLGGSRMVPMSSPSPSLASTSSVSCLSTFSKRSSLQPPSSKYLDVANETALPHSPERNVLSSLRAKSAEMLEKTKNAGRDFSNSACVGLSHKSNSDKTSRDRASTSTAVLKQTNGIKEDMAQDRGAKKSKTQDSESKTNILEEVSMVNKYLNLEEEEEKERNRTEEGTSDKSSSSKRSGKTSALDSLSSFVYRQPMTSEHPLDSLQKLLTKSSMPRMLAAASSPRPLPPHLQPQFYPYLTEQVMERMCFTPPERPASESAMPLNLSMKRGDGGSDEEGHRDTPPDCKSPSTSRDPDDDAADSPGVLGPDGELMEYKCAACSRSFASKGSYRYHLSRCHLSTVKKYGIKEAFNMSPYVYLPLDHTAKFTKYYQMAQELARKGKGSKTEEH